jgi:micrococcal nuclease
MFARIAWYGAALLAFLLLGATGTENDAFKLFTSKRGAVSANVIQPTTALSKDVLYPVVRVIDGDTIEIMKDGAFIKVRLIGIDTPEIVDPRRMVQCFGREASAKARELLNGASVIIETDPTQSTFDRYGRLLAYVYLPDGTLVNEYLIASGFAHEYTHDVPYRHQRAFKVAQRSAREAHKGLWAPDACAGTSK